VNHPLSLSLFLSFLQALRVKERTNRGVCNARRCGRRCGPPASRETDRRMRLNKWTSFTRRSAAISESKAQRRLYGLCTGSTVDLIFGEISSPNAGRDGCICNCSLLRARKRERERQVERGTCSLNVKAVLRAIGTDFETGGAVVQLLIINGGGLINRRSRAVQSNPAAIGLCNQRAYAYAKRSEGG